MKANELGDFLAGTFAALAFFWLVIGYFQQGKELRLNSDALRLQAEEMKNAVQQATAQASAQAVSAKVSRVNVILEVQRQGVADVDHVAREILKHGARINKFMTPGRGGVARISPDLDVGLLTEHYEGGDKAAYIDELEDFLDRIIRLGQRDAFVEHAMQGKLSEGGADFFNSLTAMNYALRSWTKRLTDLEADDAELSRPSSGRYLRLRELVPQVIDILLKKEIG
jgi:hypothetical protein